MEDNLVFTEKVEEHNSKTWSFYFSQPLDEVSWWFRFTIYLPFAFMGMKLIFSPLSEELIQSFFHNINLPIHEAGHVLFAFMPPLIVSFMGTGMQLLIPLIATLTLFFQTKDYFGSSIALWWFGQNFLDIAPYIDDARRGVLPLVGGNTGQTSPYGFHDWEFILGETHLITADHTIAMISFVIGKVIIGSALLYGGILLYNSRRNGFVGMGKYSE